MDEVCIIWSSDGLQSSRGWGVKDKPVLVEYVMKILSCK